MKSPLEESRQLVAYNRWANRVMLDSVYRMPAESLTHEVRGSFPTLIATIAHMAGAEWLWLQRIRGTSPAEMPAGWDSMSVDRLDESWRRVQDEQSALAAEWSEADLETAIRYRNLQGKEFTNSLWQILRHVVNHASYHRGQVTLIIRQLGHEPANTDLIRFYREETIASA